MTITRWFFRGPTGVVKFTLDGDPTAHAGWVRWENIYNEHDGSCKGRLAVLKVAGIEYRGDQLVATQNDAVVCNRGCELAKEPKCVCGCGGKNHGISHRMIGEAEEAAWDQYVDETMAPRT